MSEICECEEWMKYVGKENGLMLFGNRAKFCPWCGRKVEALKKKKKNDEEWDGAIDLNNKEAHYLW